jgi:pimeloyl-ACP methyl ester carboxylesterase
MQLLRHFSGAKSIFLVSIVILLGISGCLGHSSKTFNTSFANKQAHTADEQPRQVLILFHGLGDLQGQESGLKYLGEQLKKLFPELTIIAPPRLDSETCSIKQQAKATLDMLKLSKLADEDLVLLGESQGGLVAFSLYDQFQDQLKIKGIITNHTPWQGAPITDPADQDIRAFAQIFGKLVATSTDIQVIEAIQQLKSVYQTDISSILYNFLQAALHPYKQESNCGVTEMKPGSSFLKELETNLPKVQVPILALAGTQIHFQEAFPLLLQATGGEQFKGLIDMMAKINLDGLEPFWAKVIGAKTNEHDVFIPLYSQTAANFIGTNTYFTVKTYPRYHHFMGMSSLEQNNTIVETIKKYFEIK